jgi:ABC-type glycerol-3-phosphate transport system permease component
MGMISQIGRKSFKVRALYLTIYTILIFGSLTMIYPFLIMLSGSTKSDVDIKTFNAIPRFFYNDVWLYRKQMEALFNENILLYNYAYSENETSFEFINPPPENGNVLMSTEMDNFLKATQLSIDAYGIGIMQAPRSRTIPANLRKFKNWLKDKYGSDINKVNSSIGTEFIDWNTVNIRCEVYLQRREKPFKTALNIAVNQFKTSIPRGERYYFSVPGYFRNAILQNDYGKKIEDYNKKHGTSFASYEDICISKNYPIEADELTQKDWEHFVREILGIQYIKVNNSATPLYQEFLKVKHGENITNLNKLYGTTYEAFSEIPLVNKPIYEGMSSTDWTSFIVGWKDPVTSKSFQVPITSVYLTCVDYKFQDFVKKKYKTIENMNTKCAVSFKSFKEVMLPQKDFQYAYFKANRSACKWEFITRNYKAVTEYILFHGRAIINTVIYCSLAVLLALLINPLAAYAMSRYNLPSSYMILLFLLCTMAFPPMVTAIPNFIMLRKLGLLNTFAALILPGLANGYAIFLLKGFFDSQPKELYESAELDGASEWVLFWQIAMSLSKPILAVIALQAFNMAYANFMFAFVVCQDEKMWTLMVWLYQLQQNKGQAVVYASLIIAAIPTFMIFLFCQNIIMRGIVVPSEK